jgi:hypothetical protein
VYAAQQTVALSVYAYDLLETRPLEQQFFEETGVHLVGLPPGSNQGEEIHKLIGIVQDYHIQDVALSEIHFPPRHVLLQTFDSHVNTLLYNWGNTTVAGTYNPWNKQIAIYTLTDEVMTHELVHAEEAVTSDKDPSFLSQWRAQSPRGAYRFLRYFSHPRFNRLSDEELQRYGFVSDYGRTNVHEDVATVVTMLHESSLESVCERTVRSPRLQRKVILAEAEGFVKAGYNAMLFDLQQNNCGR